MDGNRTGGSKVQSTASLGAAPSAPRGENDQSEVRLRFSVLAFRTLPWGESLAGIEPGKAGCAVHQPSPSCVSNSSCDFAALSRKLPCGQQK